MRNNHPAVMRQLATALALLIIVVAVITSGPARANPTAPLTGIVTRILDGDTLILRTPTEASLKIRLWGIDAPEITKKQEPGQPHGEAAAKALADKVAGQPITAQVTGIDRYGRRTAIVYLGDREINAEMVADGWAWAYRQYLSGPHASKYLYMEESARARRHGLWQQENPLPPWVFRQKLIISSYIVNK